MSISEKYRSNEFDILDEITDVGDMDTKSSLLYSNTTIVIIAYTGILLSVMNLEAWWAPWMITFSLVGAILALFKKKLAVSESVSGRRYIISHTYIGDYDADEQLEIDDIVTVIAPEKDAEDKDLSMEERDMVLNALGIDRELDNVTIQSMLDSAIAKREQEYFEEYGRVNAIKDFFKGRRLRGNSDDDEPETVDYPTTVNGRALTFDEDLIAQYEAETGKNAIWSGRVTKQFQDWLEQRRDSYNDS